MAVLGFVFLMAVFVTQLLEITTRQMRVRAVDLGRADLRTTAYSAMEVSLAVMSEFREIDEGLNRSTQGWGDPIAYASGLQWPEGVEVRVSIADETGRVPLAANFERDLRNLLENMDIDYSEADIMIDSLLDWMDEDDLVRLNGAEERYYDREDPPLVPANGPINTLDTLRHIRGFDEAFFNEDTGEPRPEYYQFVDAISLHHDSRVNINTAGVEVLEMLAERGAFDTAQFLDHLNGVDRIPGTQDDNLIRSEADLRAAGFSAQADGLGFEMDVARINVDVTAGEKSFLLSALVNVGGSNSNSGNSQNNQRDAGDRADESRGSTGDGENDSNRGSPAQNSSGNAGGSSFSLIRLVENANFD